MKNTIAFSLLCCNLAFMPLTAQQMTAFEKVGQGEESVQEFFPGEHRARPVMGAYTDSERMGLFSGGQDLGGSSGWYTDTRWGDLGDGTFANPILNGDYSDPDVIRVGRKYYMTCSEFHFMGMNILESDDMVNWKIIGRIFDRMDLDGYSGMDKYGTGLTLSRRQILDVRMYAERRAVHVHGHRPGRPVESALPSKECIGLGRPVPIMGRRRASLHRTKPVGRRPHHHP